VKRIRILFFLWPSYLLVSIAALIAVAFYSLDMHQQLTVKATKAELESTSNVIAEAVTPLLQNKQYDIIEQRTYSWGNAAGYRVTIILPDGHVVGDSEKAPERLGSHADRPEIMSALKNGKGSSKRYSGSLRKDLMYVAVRIMDNNEMLGVVRLAKPVASMNDMFYHARNRLITFCLFALLISGIVSYILAIRISIPLEQIRDWAENFTRKNLRKRIPSSSIQEIDVMAQTINEMAEQLQERLQTIIEQQDEENALFPNMIEGVFTVDRQRRLTKMNETASRLFNAEANTGGQVIESSIRNPEILQMVTDVLSEKHLVQNEIYLAEKDIYLQVNANILPGSDGQPRGALFVINDITSIRKMELMHRNFVADVSHELKTPITSVIGFSETLLESDDMEPEDREHFLGIINRQANRLKNIVEDLLTLTGLEHGMDSGKIELYQTPLKSVLESAAQCCETKAKKKSITTTVTCEKNLEVDMDVHLFEQAIMNLIDNAIKYSPEEGSVHITATESETDESILVNILDEGSGISPEHHKHLFDRFYVVDKSRSRKLGGTGLGLAIVKQIVLAHNGTISVESSVGKGSCFKIRLPKQKVSETKETE
jgi:two-component system, OmpR family, phosphate regulon sensor histidine kinase PhoR